MHLYRALILPCALLATPLQAQPPGENRVVVVVHNLGGDARDSNIRNRLRSRLRSFAERVRDHPIPAGQSRPQFTFDVRRNTGLPAESSDVVEPGTDQLMGAEGIAAMSGSFGQRSASNVATSTIYIGSAVPIEAELSNRPNLFIPVQGNISTPVDLDAFEIIIEYALLRRVWRERRRELVIPIGNVLKLRLREVRSGVGYWLRCYQAIDRGTTEILRRPRPTATPPRRIGQPPPVNCQ